MTVLLPATAAKVETLLGAAGGAEVSVDLDLSCDTGSGPSVAVMERP